MQDHVTTAGSRRTLTVRGRGKASAEPDLVVLAFGISGRDPSYSAAVEKLNERVEALRGDLEGEGVDRTELKTTSFDVRAERRFDDEKEEYVFLAHQASHRIRLELDLDKELLNRVLRRVAQSASEATVIVSFDVSDRETLRRRAMRIAVADALETARVLAESTGTSLDQIDYSFIEIRRRSFSYDLAAGGRDAMRALSEPAPDVEPEALEAEEGVTIVWSI